MSVLIKGAKPPSGCRWCYFNDDSRCALIVGCDFDETNGAQRRDNCPLIELPDHGDLIDRDALIKHLSERALELATRYGGQDDYVDCLNEICEGLEYVHVVIPAERSE